MYSLVRDSKIVVVVSIAYPLTTTIYSMAINILHLYTASANANECS